MRWKPLRVAVALGLVAGTAFAVVAEFARLVWLHNGTAFLITLAAAVAAPPVAIAIWRGAWATGGRGAVQRGAFTVVALALIAGGALAVVRALERWDDVFWLVIAAGAALSLALLVVAAPRWASPRLTAGLAVAGVLAGLVASAAAVVENSTICDDANIGRTEWHSARAESRTDDEDLEHLAGIMARCDLLDGHSRKEVRQFLGAPDRVEGTSWHWSAGWVNDGIGPGDGQELIVHFGRDGRASGATLLYP